jgi:hypothetical protein
MSSRGMTMIAVFALTAAIRSAHADGQPESPQQLTQSPQQLIKDVVYNELAEHQHHGYFEYLDVTRTGQETVVKAEVETNRGRIHRTVAEDGKSLSAEQQEEESRRLQTLLTDSGQQQRLLRDYQDDEDRIARIVGLMPEGFLYQFAGVQGDDIRLTYRPNPDFKPPTYEARVFHGMAGTLWINAREKRLSRLEGKLESNVDFGYGLLGRLNKGGTFELDRVEVVPGNWKTRALDVHITGHVVLLKSIGKDETERRSDFREVSPNITLQQAEAVLARSAPMSEARIAQMDGETGSGHRGRAGNLPVAMSLK